MNQETDYQIRLREISNNVEIDRSKLQFELVESAFNRYIINYLVKSVKDLDAAIKYSKNRDLRGELEILYGQKIMELIGEGKTLPIKKREGFYNNHVSEVRSMGGIDSQITLAEGLGLDNLKEILRGRKIHHEMILGRYD